MSLRDPVPARAFASACALTLELALSLALSGASTAIAAPSLPPHAEPASGPTTPPGPITTPVVPPPWERPPEAAPASSPGQVAVPETTLRATAARLAGSAPAVTRSQHLRWKDKAQDRPEQDLPAWFRWLGRAGQWLANTSRVLVWGLGAVLVALLLVTGRLWWQQRRDTRQVQAGAAVSHVRDLDVRPESLPEDIGVAAWALWQGGQAAQALSLLYRGALSRLIHRHRVPVAAASTEGECLALARAHAGPEAVRYFSALVAAWQRSTYGGQATGEATMRALCQGFAPGLDATPVPVPVPLPVPDAGTIARINPPPTADSGPGAPVPPSSGEAPR